MSDPTFGLSITRVDNESRPAVGSDMAVVGLVGTAPDADVTMFPVDTPVLIFSDDAVALTKLGLTGTLPDAVQAVNDQLGEFEVAARIVIVRVADNANPDTVITSLVGSQASKTGIWALVEAGPVLGVIPRLIGVPGYTWQQKQGILSASVSAQGSGGTNGTFPLGFTGGTGSGALGTFTVAGGKLTSVQINGGGAYSVAPTLSFAASAGLTGASANLSLGLTANPVVAALPPVLDRLLGHAVVSGPHTNLTDFTNWRETIQSGRIIPLETAVKNLAGVVQDGAPRVLGIGVRRDHENGGRPFHSWANQPVQGIIGANRPIGFSLTDGATEGQTILSQNGGVILRGEAGVESAIASGGFVYVGTDTCSEDPLWQFYNVSRGRDYIHLLFLRTLRFYLGRFNLNGQTIEAVLSTMKLALRDLQADGDILGFKVGFSRDQNSPEQLRLGKFTVDFAAEEAPVLRYLGLRSARYRPALDTLLNDLLAQIDTTA
ncbi:MAG: phage tail protein [Alsobacter sp.]